LISTVNETVEKFYDRITLHNLNILLDCLEKSYKFAKEFNSELELRLKLWKEGFMADLK
jgi:brefeldin A-inhibited guanine nucleotide-exchange protein